MSFETDQKTILEPVEDSEQDFLETDEATTESAKNSKQDSLEKAREARRQQGNRINVRTIVHRRREPGEIASRKHSIQNFCRECLGWDPDGFGSVAENVRNCVGERCWLYPYRTGKLDENA